MRVNTSTICFVSTLSDFKKLRLAGTLKNKFFTEIEVPFALEQGSCDVILLPAISILVPTCSPSSMVDRKSTRLNSSHVRISYAVFCLKKKKKKKNINII